jgi:nicotinate-nucleotide adenylyltransferase
VTERIGLFGGTFDPVHCGHLRAAAEVLGAFALDRVLFIPSFIPPHKERPGIAPAGDRLEMVRLACREEPRFSASSIEVDAGERSYSIITVGKIRQLYPGAWIFFILGADAFIEIGTWREHEKLLRECMFIVMARPGTGLDEARRVVGEEDIRLIREVPAGGPVDAALFGKVRVFFLTIRALDISSTGIRERAAAGRPLEGLVPASVEDYIRARHLYLGT